jgi:hypothetical protein
MKINFVDKINNQNRLIFFLLIFIIILDRLILLTFFNFKYVGNDDLIFWHAVNDYSHRIFHEPYFYGQNYNLMLEALLAVPLYKIGLPIHLSLNIVTSLLALFPFILFAILLYRQNHIHAAFICLMIPVLLPIEYGMITSMTRGFVSGFLIGGLLLFCLFDVYKKQNIILFYICFPLSYFTNPNILILTIPIGIFMFLHHYRNFYFYFFTICSCLLVFLLENNFKVFYVSHSNYNVHQMWELNFSYTKLIESISHLDLLLKYLTPIFWNGNWIILLILIILSFFLYKKNKFASISLIISLLFTIALFGINKIHDQNNTVFLSSSRFFIAIPILSALAFYWLLSTIEISRLKKLTPILLLILFFNFTYKIYAYPIVIENYVSKVDYGPVGIKNISELKDECEIIETIIKKYNIDIVVLFPRNEVKTIPMEFLNYGCPLMLDSGMNTMLTKFERRTRVYEEEKLKIRKNILVYGKVSVLNFEKLKSTIKISRINKNTLIILNNSHPLDELSKIINLVLTRN